MKDGVTGGGTVFGYTEEEWMLKESVREYIDKNVAPYFFECSKDEETESKYYHKWIKEMGELGFLKAWVPEDLGGYGMRLHALCAVAEEVARGNGGLAIIALENPLLGVSMARSAPGSWAKWGQAILDGDIIFASSMCSPEGQVNFTEQADIATFDEETREWVLNGEKAFCSGGTIADAITICGNYHGDQYKFAMDPQNTPGLTTHHNLEFGPTGWYASYTMKNVRIPEEMGGPYPGGCRNNHGPKPSARGCTFALGVSAMNLGSMEAALEQTINYLNVRTFDFKPISSLGEIQHRFVDMKIKVETARSFLMTAMNMVQDNHKDAVMYARMCKAYCSDRAREVTSDCVQLWGTLGANVEAGICRYMKDTVGFGIGVCPSSEQYAAVAKEMGFDVGHNDVYLV